MNGSPWKSAIVSKSPAAGKTIQPPFQEEIHENLAANGASKNPPNPRIIKGLRRAPWNPERPCWAVFRNPNRNARFSATNWH